MPTPPSPQCRPKRRRVTQACDFCHHRGLKCRPASHDPEPGVTASCLTCVEYGQHCTRLRQAKRRGTKPRDPSLRRQHVSDTASSSMSSAQSSRIDFGFIDIQPTTRPGSGTSNIRNRKIVTALLDVYLDTIHPIFPFFCERQLWVGWRDGSFPADEAEYMSLICMCALSVQHVGSGALFSDDLPDTETTSSLSRDYLAEALRIVSLDFEKPCINQIRSYGLLALLGAQRADKAMVHKYLGLYHGLCAHWYLHDERQWPRGLSDCELEVRRRLWWIMYRLEVHTACVFGSIVRCPEAQLDVGYPAGAHHPAFIPGRDGDFEDWFSGWNSATDLYRVLEHVIAEFRVQRQPRSSIVSRDAASTTAATQRLADKLSRIQQDILPHFRFVSCRSSDSGRNRCGFQASNILCTIHLAWMIWTILQGDFESACQRADDMITTIKAIPIEYVRAIGSPLLLQLAGVGHMLAGVASKRELSQEHQTRCRALIETIIQYLSTHTGQNSTATTEGQRLRSRLEEARLAAASSADVVDEPGLVGYSPFDWTDNVEGLSADLHDLFSTHMARSLTWPYEPRPDEDGA